MHSEFAFAPKLGTSQECRESFPKWWCVGEDLLPLQERHEAPSPA